MSDTADQQEHQPRPYKSAFTLFTDSKDLVMQNLTPFAVLAAIPFLLSLAASSDAPRQGGVFGYPASASAISWKLAGAVTLLAVAAIVINVVIQAMLFVLTLKAADGKKPGLDEVYNATKKKFWNLVGLMLVVGLTIIAGLVFFIIPGLIFIRRYLLAPYVLLDKDTKILDAMKQSADLTKPFSGSIWGIIGVGILISLTGVVPLIGPALAAVLTMLYAVAPALRYRELQKLQADNA